MDDTSIPSTRLVPRVLQEQGFERLGSTRTHRVDVRLIAATNSDLEQMVADKSIAATGIRRVAGKRRSIRNLLERIANEHTAIGKV